MSFVSGVMEKYKESDEIKIFEILRDKYLKE